MNSIAYERDQLCYIVQMDFFKKMIGFLDVFNEVDSLSFKEHTKELIAGFKFNEGEDIK